MTLKNKKLIYPIHIVLLCLGKSIRMIRVNRSDQKNYARVLATLIFGRSKAYNVFILCLCFGLLSAMLPWGTMLKRMTKPICYMFYRDHTCFFMH